MNKQAKGLIYGSVSALSWGTYGTFLILLGSVGIQKTIIMALVPTCVMLYGLLRALFEKQSIFKVNPKVLIFMAFHGLIIVNGMNLCYANAVKTLPVGIVSLINFCNVILIMVGSWLFFRLRLARYKVFAAILAILGISLMLRVFDETFSFDGAGVMWAIGVAVFAASSSLLYRFYLNKKQTESSILFWINFFAAAFMWIRVTPLGIIENVSHSISRGKNPLMVCILLAGFFLIPLVVSYYTFLKAYEYVEPSYVSITYGLDPAIAVILGFFIFGQRLDLVQILGITVVVGAILYIKWKESKETI